MTGAELRNPKKYIESFLTIRDKSGKLSAFRLKPAQERLYGIIKAEHDAGKPVRIVILKARQLGFSTLVEGLFFQDAATRPLVRTLIAAHVDDATANVFRMNKLFYDCLPEPVRPMRKNSNAQEIIFENPTKDAEEKKRNPGLRSSIRCVTAGGKGLGRSDTLTNVHASEAAFWPRMNETLDGLLQAVPDSPDTAVIIESTPNGYNEFKDFWDGAVSGKNSFVPVFFPWYEEPEYRKSVPPGTEWTEEEKKLRTAYGLDDEQLYWRRCCIAEKLRGDAEMFKQEYPSNPEEAFLMSGRPFFDNSAILLLIQSVPEPMRVGRFVYGESENKCPESWQWQDAPDGEISIYAMPEPRAPYVAGGDTAGDGSDRFTAVLLDNRTGEQAAELFYDGKSELYYAQQLYCLGKFYNDALLAPEINFSSYPVRKLEEWLYTRLFIREKHDDATHQLDVKKFGWRTDPMTRPVMLANLHSVMRDCGSGIKSARLLREMLTFIRAESMRPEAAPGEHDDLVMAAAIAYEIRPQQSYIDEPEPVQAREKLIDKLDPGRRRRNRR